MNDRSERREFALGMCTAAEARERIRIPEESDGMDFEVETIMM